MNNKTILEASKCVNIIVSVAVKEKGKILVVKEAKKEVRGLWNFPSGKVNIGENLIKAAERETLEETGYKIKIADFCFVDHYMWVEGTGVTFRFNFWGKIIGKRKTVKLVDDVSAAHWISEKELKKIMKEKKLRGAYTERMAKAVLKGQRLPLAGINSLANRPRKTLRAEGSVVYRMKYFSYKDFNIKELEYNKSSRKSTARIKSSKM